MGLSFGFIPFHSNSFTAGTRPKKETHAFIVQPLTGSEGKGHKTKIESGYK